MSKNDRYNFKLLDAVRSSNTKRYTGSRNLTINHDSGSVDSTSAHSPEQHVLRSER